MKTEERLEKLEKELTRGRWVNRGLLAALGVVLAGIVLAWAFAPGTAGAQGAGAVPEVIRAKKFIVEDENGKSRAGLAVSPFGPELVLFDENGKTRAILRAGKDGPALALYDENGKLRVQLGTDKDGAGLTLRDENGKSRAGLTVTKFGPALGLLDEKGEVRAALGATQTETSVGRTTTYPESSLIMFGPNGRVIWSAP